VGAAVVGTLVRGACVGAVVGAVVVGLDVGVAVLGADVGVVVGAGDGGAGHPAEAQSPSKIRSARHSAHGWQFPSPAAAIWHCAPPNAAVQHALRHASVPVTQSAWVVHVDAS
jgi:hypothetical protein